MAIDNDNLQRDPHIARLLESAEREEPSAALDDALLAAARREVSARPQSVGTTTGGGGPASAPPLRAKRNWYVPVSIAAVVVMSASLVTIVHQEKGDELAQPPRTASVPTAAPAPMQKPQDAAKEPAARTQPATLRDAGPAKLKIDEAKPAVDTVVAGVAAPLPKADSADGYADTLRKQAENLNKKRAAVSGKAESGAEPARRDAQSDAPAARPAPEPARLPETAARPGAALGDVLGSSAGGAGAPAAPPAAVRESRPEPFPAATGQASAKAKRDAAPARDRAESNASSVRAEADASTTREVMRQAPAAPSPVSPAPPAPPLSPAPPAPVVAATPRAAPADDGVLSRLPPAREGRVVTAPPRAVAKSVAPAIQLSSPQQASRPAWLLDLDNQPAEKWLARLAEFKRDGRVAEADELMVEFRRRFPDHPANAAK